MILVVHKISSVLKVKHISKNRSIDFDKNKSIGNIVYKLSQEFPEELILWCHESVVDDINYDGLDLIFHHDAILVSYSTSESYTVPGSIGYVEQSPFLNVKKDVQYPTWLMSSTIGGAKGILIANFGDLLNRSESFPLVLNHMSKVAQKIGIMCYSNPDLLCGHKEIEEQYSNIFSFVRTHYKMRWMFLLLLNLLIYEKKFPLESFLRYLLGSRKKFDHIKLKNMEINSTKEIDEFSIDVIIPTVGRKKYLYDILSDLANQTLLPQNVIIVEQTKDGVSELDYINQNWPFKIKHQCISKFGACNARNLAQAQVTSNWVFFADDDIRIEPNFLNKGIDVMNSFKIDVGVFKCETPNLKKYNFLPPHQTTLFGAGSSIVNREVIKNCKFNLLYEFGFGEDLDFGMQIRNNGFDIHYISEPTIIHLKAPIGGFRLKHEFIWNKEKNKPKPSPTISLFNLKHLTKEQFLGYKLSLFIKYYNEQPIKNPFKYYVKFKKQWNISVKWANYLLNNNEEVY